MDFFQQYFLEPIETGAGYNIVNTAAYAAILIASLFVLAIVLRRLKIKLDNRLWSDLIPFVLLGGVLRALEDTVLPHTWLLITPGIYLTVFCLAFSAMLVQRYTRLSITGPFGWSLLAFSLIAVIANAKNWTALALTLALVLACFLITVYLLKIFKTRIMRGKNWQAVMGHMLDASASFMALTYLCVAGGRYFEQHVLPSALFAGMGVWVFIPLKIAIVLLALLVIDKEADKEWNWMLKFTILVLGLGPGTRDLLTALMNSSFC